MANPSAKASRPSCSSVHTRIFPSVATLNSRAWFLCLVSGNHLTCSKCHGAQDKEGCHNCPAPAACGDWIYPGTGAEPGTSLVPNELLELAQMHGEKCIWCLGLNLHCSFCGSPDLTFGMGVYGTFTQLQTRAFSQVADEKNTQNIQSHKALRKPDCITSL